VQRLKGTAKNGKREKGKIESRKTGKLNKK
jgi:hypothetical protein